MKKNIEVTTIGEWIRCLSILFDMGYTWYSGDKDYHADYFTNGHTRLIEFDENTKHISSHIVVESPKPLYKIVTENTENGIIYKFVEKHEKHEKWIICPSVDSRGNVSFSACDKETGNVILELYYITWLGNRIVRHPNIPLQLTRKGYSLMEYEFDSEGRIIIK